MDFEKYARRLFGPVRPEAALDLQRWPKLEGGYASRLMPRPDPGTGLPAGGWLAASFEKQGGGVGLDFGTLSVFLCESCMF